MYVLVCLGTKTLSANLINVVTKYKFRKNCPMTTSSLRPTTRHRLTRHRFGLLAGAILLGTVSTAALAPSASAAPRLSPGDRIRVRMHEDMDVRYKGSVSASGTIPIPYLGEFAIAGKTPDQAEKNLAEALEKELYQKATVTVTLVKQAPGQIYVYGAVQNPGVVQMPEMRRFTVLQLVSEVGGLTNWAAPGKAYVLRRNPEEEGKQRIPLNLKQALTPQKPPEGLALKSGDVVFVPGIAGDEQTMSTEGVEVTIVGEVRGPGIVRFAPGERHTLMRAVFKAGGLGKYAKGSAVKLIQYDENNERSVRKIDLAQILDKGRLKKDVQVHTGDMIIVPQKLINF